MNDGVRSALSKSVTFLREVSWHLTTQWDSTLLSIAWQTEALSRMKLLH